MRNIKLLALVASLFTFVVLAPAQTVSCASDDGNRHYCKAETRAGVQLLRQISGSPCRQDYSWGFDDRGIWVDHGCRAEFSLQSYDRRRDRDASAGTNGIVSCSSDDGNRRHCDADTRQGVLLSRQRSGTPCQRGYSWDSDDRGIWVDHGCRADFQINSASAPSSSTPISCSSDDGKRHYCDADTSRGVDLIKQRSDTRCEQGRTWGYDSRGIWVDRGCRADFQTR